MNIFSSLTGTLVNVATVLLGSTLGLLLGRALPERLGKALMTALGLCTVFIGISGSLSAKNTLVIILSLVIGTVIGELCDLDKGVNKLGTTIENKLGQGGKGTVAQGFVTASLVFCVGAMTIVGSLNSGLTGDHTMLYTKSCLDLISSLVFASTLGIGVLLSAGFVLVFQGGIALLAGVIAPFLSTAVVNEMTAVGSILIIGLGLNLIGVTKLKMMNYVPAIFLPILLCPVYDWVAGWVAHLL